MEINFINTDKYFSRYQICERNTENVEFETYLF